MRYREALVEAMTIIGKHPKSIFLGQSCLYEGTAMFGTLSGVPIEKRYEMPVAEDMQQGAANGMALAGLIPVSIFPRWNFMLLATNQIVNHLDKMPDYSGYPTKVIIRTSIGSERPLHPQHQHVGDYSVSFASMLKNIQVIRLDEADSIIPAYEYALNRKDGKSTILVEWGDYYNEK
jgi:pyruvate/2-oxoglutarate/acetoin dehydrogenase E1 component